MGVVPMGVRPDGQMELPENLEEAGWYRFGPRPGAEAGSAVIAGHVDSHEQGIGPLAKIREALPGDQVLVFGADGSTGLFQVVSVERIAKAGLPLDEVFRRDGAPVLRIVTCGGEYSGKARSYLDNVVVTATQVTQ